MNAPKILLLAALACSSSGMFAEERSPSSSAADTEEPATRVAEELEREPLLLGKYVLHDFGASARLREKAEFEHLDELVRQPRKRWEEERFKWFRAGTIKRFEFRGAEIDLGLWPYLEPVGAAGGRSEEIAVRIPLVRIRW